MLELSRISHPRVAFVALLTLSVGGCTHDPYALPAPIFPRAQPGLGSIALHTEALRELNKVTSTTYAHIVKIDEERGLYEYDCSGFVGYALSNVAPRAFAEVNALYNTKRPNVKLYVHLLRAIGPGETRGLWHRVGAVPNLRPGDLVAWIATDKRRDHLGIVNSGHIVIVDSVPKEQPNGEWVVPVIDATTTGHGPNDPRRKPDETGLGRGSIVLHTEDGSLPTAYRWGDGASDPLIETEIVMGRVL